MYAREEDWRRGFLRPDQSRSLASLSQQSENCCGGDGEGLSMESLSLPTKPGELALYRSVRRQPEDLESEDNKLNPLKEISRSKTMVSTMKPQPRVSFESELTFAPKLNAQSIKLARERGDRLQQALHRRAAALHAETESNFTFKPKVSSNSVKIVQNMKMTFLDRQQLHVEKQRKHTENLMVAYQAKTRLTPVNVLKSPTRSKKSKSKNSESYEGSRQDLQGKSSFESIPSSLSNTTSENRVPEIEVIPDSTDESDSPALSTTELTTRNSRSKPGKTCEGAKRILESSPYNQSVENLCMNKCKRTIRTVHKRGLTHPQTRAEECEGWNNSTKVDNGQATSRPERPARTSHSRTTSQPSQYCGKMKYDDPLFEKVRQAKEVADIAIKNKKVFICHGTYPIVRATLRRRGWVEKHFKGSLISKKAKRKQTNKDYDSDDDSCDSGDDSGADTPSSNVTPRGKNKDAKKKLAPKCEAKRDDGSDDSESDDDNDDDDEDWNAGKEDDPNCEFNLMSRMVRNAVPSLIWTVKRDDVDFKFLRKDQIVNHYSKAHSFTTKVGLCMNLRNLLWYENTDAMSFFPRCHRLGAEEDILDFVDDFRLTSAVALVRWVVQRHENGRSSHQSSSETDTQGTHDMAAQSDSDHSPRNVLSVRALTLALEACREFLHCKEHLDIDDTTSTSSSITEVMWDEIVNSSYQLRSGAVIANASPFARECQSTLNQLREHLPQFDIDGVRNVWIVKPGAKSRGRGIVCMDKLEDIMKLTGNIVGQKEGRWVVQKYIERPLLIYGVKFDIRQWFLVTDWNPLTLWFYEDCYLRFCSQNFSLEDFHVSIHLANNSIQKNYDNNSTRDKRLPDENMWSSDEFKAYLKKRDLGHMWDSVIYPGMKQGVMNVLQSCQEVVECRKNSFELYGADFIIGVDYKPWLIEINCSPTMGASTAVTRKLCAQVLEDTMKVILDRKEDKNCGTGRFELAYKQAHVSAPPYIGINMSVEGTGIFQKTAPIRRSSSAKLTTLARPQENKKGFPSPQQQESTDMTSNNTKATSNRTTFVKKYEGAWAMGCISTSQKPAPLPSHTPRPREDDKPARKLVKSKAEFQVTNGQTPRVSRTMTIPKAVLRYSSEAGMKERTQLPISIGPDSRGNAF
ncbi:tubulin tyrosine ligase 3 isoform X2 [Nematostella vectensis]|uniref:tubulin tyrosine ligase 3 isoform X2 n=1 Tax=Nematostella vectensis TaxID=45351 RepID=UPI0020770AC8|nr:tubulin tyrosine ligase 3 isoform X2 [Nematostella vectensis]